MFEGNKMKLALAAGVLMAAAGAANAAVDPGVLTAITTAGTDANTIAAAVLVVFVGIFAIKLGRRAL